MDPMLASALVLGAAGSAHCIGMCGPIALAVPSPGRGVGARLRSTLLLNSGRLFTYALLGAAIGTFGHGLRLVGLQQVVSIGAGVVLLLSVLLPDLVHRLAPGGPLAMGIARLRGKLAHNLRRTAPEALFLTGVLNGLLPCGLLYAALLGASTNATAADGALFMLFFGLGTWPALIALRMGGGMIGPNARVWLRKASPVLVSVVAVLMILRGLELGIPYVSPGAVVVPAEVTVCH